jgi:hypothetical protein
VLREFALLAGIGTVATSLTLVFVALFSLGPLAAVALALGLALTVYAVSRQWILNQMVGASVLTTERTFEQLYRVAREVQDHPDRPRGCCRTCCTTCSNPRTADPAAPPGRGACGRCRQCAVRAAAR